MLEVRLLGQFDVRLDGKPITIASRSAQSLFAYLILNPGTMHRRELLAGLLWPDTREQHARDNLRHALWRVRRALSAERSSESPYIISDDIAIAFNIHSNDWVDTSILECAASERATTNDLINLCRFTGVLLPGFTTIDPSWNDPGYFAVRTGTEHS
jgi:DNA-binding SARP family transcriptional activator